MSFEIKFFLSQPVLPPLLATKAEPREVKTSNGIFSSVDLRGFLKDYSSPEGMLTIGSLIFIILLLRFLVNGKGKITTGKICGTAERLAATSTALTQIKQRKHNKVCLWCGTPRYWWRGKKLRGAVSMVQTMMGAMPTIWLPHAERGTLVVGSPGSGKTFSTIDRALESAMIQGFPIVLYDKKGDQMILHAALADRYGYKVYVFAPEEPYSGVINPLDFIKSPQDSVMAGELGQVINRNASSGQSGKGDEFFSKAGDLLAKALLQLVKSHPNSDYHDMAMLYSFLRLPNLVKRIDYAVQTKQMDEWVATSFIQFLSAKEAEKTISGILTTAAGMFSSFIQADLLRAFMGKSNIPIYLNGREIIIFKLDDARRTVVGPLLAAAIHLVVVNNLAEPRKDPLIISLDEFPSIRLDCTPQWVNEYRSNGGCFILGIQSLEQLYEIYGDKMGAAIAKRCCVCAAWAQRIAQIASACSTHVLFNPGNPETAKRYSERYGEKEIVLRNNSVSQTQGQRTQSWNESLQKLPIISVDEIMRFPQGKCVLTSPAYKSGAEGFIPYPLTIPVPKSDIKRADECKKLWHEQVRPRLSKRVKLDSLEQLTASLYERVAAAEAMLPLPDEPKPQQESRPTTGAAGQQPPESVQNGKSFIDTLIMERRRSRRAGISD